MSGRTSGRPEGTDIGPEAVAPFACEWLNEALRGALRRPPLTAAEDARLLADAFPPDPLTPPVDPRRLLVSPFVSPWLKAAIERNLNLPPASAGRDAHELLQFMLRIVGLMFLHGMLDGPDDTMRVAVLVGRIRGMSGDRVIAMHAMAAQRLLSAAHAPDAGRSDALDGFLTHLDSDAEMARVMKVLADLPDGKRRLALREMAKSVLARIVDRSCADA
ncbi:hypothetical protein [Azospirillum halopraeferens]|uniref:hypothetical protein n=1 Tax=Azospirillum halopraeferens TaxID=34010 RepID=UPI000405B7CB|nr:hypothetical protein [Azospirillum halopraeferens]